MSEDEKLTVLADCADVVGIAEPRGDGMVNVVFRFDRDAARNIEAGQYLLALSKAQAGKLLADLQRHLAGQ